MNKNDNKNIPSIFQKQVEKYQEKPIIGYKKNGEYVDLSWKDFNRSLLSTAAYLLSLGVKKGDPIGIYSENRYEWWIAELAILTVGAVSVPIHHSGSMQDTEFILNNSESTICFTSDKPSLKKLLNSEKIKLKNIIIFDDYQNKEENNSISSLRDIVKNSITDKESLKISERLNKVTDEDLASIIYTSGTTGSPRGVMLTHKNIYSNASQCAIEIGRVINEDSKFLSFLPLSHALEKTAGYYLPILLGSKVHFAESVTTVLQDMQLTRPDILVSVPRIYEKIQLGIQSKLVNASMIKKLIFNRALKVGEQVMPYHCKKEKLPLILSIRYKIASKLVFSKLKRAIGFDKLKMAISGGGPLAITNGIFFLGMGLDIMEGYGLTETSPVTNFNRETFIKPGTVGPALPGTEIKISDEGEILIKGPQVMKGYYKDPESTKEVFTADGYFKSGDIGLLDEDNFLIITGRIKDIIITSGGKNISPQNIENALKKSFFIEQVAVVGDKQKFPGALIVPNFESLQKWCEDNSIETENRKSLIENKKVYNLFQKEVEKYTSDLSRVEKIKVFQLMDREWTVEKGELTPTLKIKRKKITEKHAKLIEKMYSGFQY